MSDIFELRFGSKWTYLRELLGIKIFLNINHIHIEKSITHVTLFFLVTPTVSVLITNVNGANCFVPFPPFPHFIGVYLRNGAKTKRTGTVGNIC